MDVLHRFYTSKAWRDLSFALKIQANGKCARCGDILTDTSKLIAHHKTELNEHNVNDISVSLNPANIEIICFDCHNKQHRRFGNAKQVYIVWGSPLSGKTSTVRQLMQYGDIVLDMDALWQAVTMQPEYVKPDNCRYNVFALRDSLLDQIKTRYGQWYNAWIVGGYPDRYERERLAQSLGAELIQCEATRQECYERIAKSGKPDVWRKYVDEWWSVYDRTG